jgi:uncharacterized protein
MRIKIAGEELELIPERALYWPALATLIVADLHWGKAASFRAHGIPVPAGTTAADLARLEATLGYTGARRLLVLGDLIHARVAQQAQGTLELIRGWRQRWARLECLLVRGNHDRSAGDPPADLGFQVVDQLHEAPFVLQHHPGVSDLGYTLAGHLHPGIKLKGRGDRVRLPCFHFSPGCGILPAFGSFTGWATPELGPGDRVFVIGDGEVHEIPIQPVPSTRNC